MVNQRSRLRSPFDNFIKGFTPSLREQRNKTAKKVQDVDMNGQLDQQPTIAAQSTKVFTRLTRSAAPTMQSKPWQNI